MSGRIVLAICISSTFLISCGTLKKKKFLDYFSTYTSDTLTIHSFDHAGIYTDPSAPFHIKGTAIDTSFLHIFSLEEAEDLRYYVPNASETGPLAYYKVKLNLGYYFLIIRSGGEYWNSRFYACLYHSGENKVTRAILIAENFGEAGDIFKCKTILKKENDTWNMHTHHFFQEPIDYKKYGTDSVHITHVDIVYSTIMDNDRYYFKEVSNNISSTKH
jgi:hypothetical protein